MNAKPKLQQLQRKLISSFKDNISAHHFFNMLTSKRLFNAVEELLPEHRERKFPPTETLSMFMAQLMNADRSCQNIMNELAISRFQSGLSPGTTNTGSYCKARARLPLDMIAQLTRFTGSMMTEQSPDNWKWNYRPVRLVDGTTVVLPDTPDNQEHYPQTTKSKGCPIARIVSVICLGSGGVLDARIGTFCGKGSGEQTLFRQMLDVLNAGDLLLGDAYFGTYFLLAELQCRGIDAVFEQYGARKRSTDFSKGTYLGKKDHLITYTKPTKPPSWMTQEDYLAAPDTIQVRELEVNHKILVTTLLCPKTTHKSELADLYHQRWHVELDLRNIKTSLGMSMLSCKSAEMAEKEIWVYLLVHNMIRSLMAGAAQLSGVLPRQLSFKHSLQLWRIWRQRLSKPKYEADFQALLLLIIQNIVGDRPGRVEPRAIKRWEKSYPLLTKPKSFETLYESTVILKKQHEFGGPET